MEKFAVDLDRVLDEFELNEDLALEPADGRECGLIDYETPIAGRENYGHDDFHISQKSALNSHLAESGNNFLDLSEADFAPTKSTTRALVHKMNPEINNGSSKDELIRLVSEERKTPTIAADLSHKLENGTSIVSGIKVLHCDETISKEYLLTLGRKWDESAVNSPTTIQNIVEDNASIRSAPENVEHPIQEAFILTEEIQDEGISMEECEIEADHHSQNQHSLVLNVEEIVSPCNNGAGEDNSEESFVTPERTDQHGMEITDDRPLIGFGGDVDITDEEIQKYLEETDTVAGVTSSDNHASLEREEFFTPMVEDPVGLMTNKDIYHGPDHSGLFKLDNSESIEEFGGNVGMKKDNIANSDLLLLELSDGNPSDTGVPQEKETGQTKEKTHHSKMLEVDQISSDWENRSNQSHQDVGINQEIVEHCQTVSMKTEQVKEHQNRSKEKKLENLLQDKESDIIVEVLHNPHVDVLSPASIDDGFDANLYISEQNLHDDISPGAYDDLSDGQLRLQRPTSLHLPGKIEVTPPSNAIAQEMLETEESKSFASLMATAGSPDAGLGISPGSFDEQETPDYADSPQPSLTDEERRLGKVAPMWVPDAEAPNCMQCDAKFTVIKRRHHCRACGKVLCAQCCGLKAKLHYMENKEARVCQFCLGIMEKVLLLEQTSGGVAGATGATGGAGSFGPTDAWRPSVSQNRAPNPNNPSEYCSIIPPLQQCLANANAPPPTVMVPVGVLKRGGDGRPRGEPKQVMFSDGIRPGGDLTELDGPEPKLPFRRQGRLQKKVERSQGQMPAVSDSCHPSSQQREYSLNDDLDMEHILSLVKDDATEPLVFVLIKNLRVLVKILTLSCCVHKTCWIFTTCGMVTVGQDEIVILLEVLPDEKAIPYDIFYHLIDIYDEAGKGVTVSGMGHTVFTRSCLGSRDHGGFLFVHPTFQCLQKIPLPPSPYLFAILLQKWEIPWAKVFPLRLLLRLGHEFRYYPSSLVGFRFRKPVFCEIGHTIVNLLADFRNYQYSLPSVPGLVIHMKDKQTYICCPRNRYDEMVKALNSSIDHVLALAASFSSEADSHLVCVQNEDGNYQTQAITIKDKPRNVTGASFVVFNGALKSSSGLTAKSSIVEDGLMVQIPGDSMLALRQALRDMRDYVVPCGPIGAESPDEVVHISWVDDDQNVNVGVKSPIDGMAMDGISSIRIHCGTDYVGDGHLIRWTEVYLIRSDDGVGNRRSDPVDVSKVSDTLAQAGCVALAHHLGNLYSAGLTKIGLRVTLDSDNVGYEIGAGGQRLPATYMNDLDSELVPAMHCAVSPSQEGSVLLELIFHIIQQ